MEFNKSLQIVDTKKVAMDYDKSIVIFVVLSVEYKQEEV